MQQHVYKSWGRGNKRLGMGWKKYLFETGLPTLLEVKPVNFILCSATKVLEGL